MTRTCKAFRKNDQGELIPCPHKPIRFIAYRDTVDCLSGAFCARHSVALRRQEVKGQVEILQDEPIEEIPFQGEPVSGPERTYTEAIGLESRI